MHDGFSCPSCDIVERLKKRLEELKMRGTASNLLVELQKILGEEK